MLGAVAHIAKIAWLSPMCWGVHHTSLFFLCIFGWMLNLFKVNLIIIKKITIDKKQEKKTIAKFFIMLFWFFYDWSNIKSAFD